MVEYTFLLNNIRMSQLTSRKSMYQNRRPYETYSFVDSVDFSISTLNIQRVLPRTLQEKIISKLLPSESEKWVNHLTPMKYHSYILQHACPRSQLRSAILSSQRPNEPLPDLSIEYNIYIFDERRRTFNKATHGRFFRQSAALLKLLFPYPTKIEGS